MIFHHSLCELRATFYAVRVLHDMDALGLTKQLKRVLPPIAIEQVGEQLRSNDSSKSVWCPSIADALQSGIFLVITN